MMKSQGRLIRRNRARTVALSGLVTALLHAQAATADDAATARALFDQGLADMQAGRYETGCPALSRAYRMDSRPGILFTLAECAAKWGRVATAVARYSDYLAWFERMTPEQRSKQLDRNEVAAQQKAALAPQVPMLTLVLPESAPNGTVVWRDGVKLDPAWLRVGLPVDPGEHVVAAQAPGGAVTELRVSLALGERKAITLAVKLAAAPSPSGDPGLYKNGVPPGYTVETRSHYAMVVGGSIMFGVPYGVSTFAAVLGGSQFFPLLIPGVGPFITLGTLDTSGPGNFGGVFVLVLDGLLQTGGLVMWIAGATFAEKVLRRTSQSPPKPTEPLHPEVVVGLGSTSLKWRF